MKSFLAEMVGTFFLTFTIASQDPLAIGLMLMVMVYSLGHVSGAHFNPIVTLSLWLCNAFRSEKVARYLSAQSLGAIAASALIYIFGGQPFSAPMPESIAFIIGTEILLAFVFATLVLTITTNNRYVAVPVGGLIIGLGLTVAAFFGALINPAIALTSIINNLILGDFTIITLNLVGHVAGPIVGAVMAAFWFSYINHFDTDVEHVKS